MVGVFEVEWSNSFVPDWYNSYALGIEVSRDDGALRLKLYGELDIDGLPCLRRCVERLALYRAERIVLDLARLSFLDLLGLRELARAVTDLAPYVRVEIQGTGPHVLKLVSLTGIAMPGLVPDLDVTELVKDGFDIALRVGSWPPHQYGSP